MSISIWTWLMSYHVETSSYYDIMTCDIYCGSPTWKLIKLLSSWKSLTHTLNSLYCCFAIACKAAIQGIECMSKVFVFSLYCCFTSPITSTVYIPWSKCLVENLNWRYVVERIRRYVTTSSDFALPVVGLDWIRNCTSYPGYFPAWVKAAPGSCCSAWEL